jgi:hypothetical protein
MKIGVSWWLGIGHFYASGDSLGCENLARFWFHTIRKTFILDELLGGRYTFAQSERTDAL